MPTIAATNRFVVHFLIVPGHCSRFPPIRKSVSKQSIDHTPWNPAKQLMDAFDQSLINPLAWN
jgi:hypothetical protein